MKRLVFPQEMLHLPFSQVETTNPEVTVWIVNLSKPKYLFPLQIKPTRSVEPGSYVTGAFFFGENNVAVVWMNRKQNTSVIVTCKSQSNFNCTDVSEGKKFKQRCIFSFVVVSYREGKQGADFSPGVLAKRGAGTRSSSGPRWRQRTLHARLPTLRQQCDSPHPRRVRTEQDSGLGRGKPSDVR